MIPCETRTATAQSLNYQVKDETPYAVRITVGYNENSSQIYKYLGYYPTRKDAMIALADYNNNPYDLEHAKLTFSDVFEKWSVKSFDGLSKSAKTSYSASYKHCAPIHNMHFQKLNAIALQDIIDNIKAPSAKFSTQLLLSQLYKYAIKHDIVQKNYAKMIEIEPLTVQKKAQVFTPDEIETLWENTHVDNLDIILILLYTGFRVMELLEKKYIAGFSCYIDRKKQYFYLASDEPLNDREFNIFVHETFYEYHNQGKTPKNLQIIKDCQLKILIDFSAAQNVQHTDEHSVQYNMYSTPGTEQIVPIQTHNTNTHSQTHTTNIINNDYPPFYNWLEN